MSAQDVLRCDTCEVTIIHSYCDTCRTNICKTCVVNHIADEHHKHVIVPFEERRSTLIYQKCGKHNKNCEFECKTCEHMVCSSCRASVQNAGHVFVEVLENYRTKKKMIKKDTNELES